MHRLGLRAGGLNQVPGDGLAFAIGVGRQVDLTRLLDALLELLDQLGLVSRHQIGRREIVVDVDPERALWQIANVAHRGLHGVAAAKVLADGAGFRWRFDDDQTAATWTGSGSLRLAFSSTSSTAFAAARRGLADGDSGIVRLGSPCEAGVGKAGTRRNRPRRYWQPRTGRNLRHHRGAMSRTPWRSAAEKRRSICRYVLSENVILRSVVPHQSLEFHRQHQGRGRSGAGAPPPRPARRCGGPPCPARR